MKISRRTIIVFLLLCIAVFFMQYDFFKSNTFRLPPKSIHFFDKNIFDTYKEEYNTSIDTNPFWGFAQDMSKFKEKNETKTTILDINVTQKEGTNVLCIVNSCYRLIGIYYNNTNARITIFNKTFKTKIRDYRLHDILQDGIAVSKITSTKVFFEDVNSTRKWHFELFDVNSTKYKPKEIQE